MKKIIVLLFVLHSCVCLFAQGKKNVSSIVCNVMCTTDFEVSGKPLAGMAGSMNNKKLYVYQFEDVQLFLINGTDTLSKAKTDLEGKAVFRDVPYGEYKIIVKKDKFVAKPRPVSVSKKNVNTTLFLDMFEF